MSYNFKPVYCCRCETRAGGGARSLTKDVPPEGYCAYLGCFGLHLPPKLACKNHRSVWNYQLRSAGVHWSGRLAMLTLNIMYLLPGCCMYYNDAMLFCSMQAGSEAPIHPQTPPAVLAVILKHPAVAKYLSGHLEPFCAAASDSQITRLLVQMLVARSAPGVSEDTDGTILQLTRPFLDRSVYSNALPATFLDCIILLTSLHV